MYVVQILETQSADKCFAALIFVLLSIAVSGHHFQKRPDQLQAADQQAGFHQGPGAEVGRIVLLSRWMSDAESFSV
jgi:hypothetical protein